MIDNFNQISKLLSFENSDQFYFAQVIARKKENPELGSNSKIVKTYYIKSVKELLENKGEMLLLSNYHNARTYINLNKRGLKQACFNTLKKITDQILCEHYLKTYEAYNSVCGKRNSKCDKIWLVDIDEKGRFANEVLQFIESVSPNKVLIDIIETKAGVHLVTKPFNTKVFKEKYPDVEIHKNNPVNLYIP
jgi:hypothetical protein